MNLQALRDAVRSQLDLDEDDLPNGRLDLYLREGFERTISQRSDWPFYATQWSVDTDSSDTWVATMPTDLNALSSVSDEEGQPLVHLGHDTADQSFHNSVGNPVYFSVWGLTVYVWPKPDAVTSIGLRGWRRPIDWVSNGAAAEADADTRLHLPLIHYACSREYAFQEDEVLEDTYLRSWDRGVKVAIEDIFRQTLHSPVIMSRGLALYANSRVARPVTLDLSGF